MKGLCGLVRRIQNGLCLALALAVFGGGMDSAEAQAELSYQIKANVSKDKDRIAGKVVIFFESPKQQSALHFWLYPDRLQRPPAVMDEINARWIYPGEIQRGGLQIDEVRVDGRSGTFRKMGRSPAMLSVHGSVLEVRSATALKPGKHKVEMSFRLRIPERFGRLGKVDDLLSLLGPWYPLLVQHGTPFNTKARHDVSLRCADPASWVWMQGASAKGALRVRRRGVFVPAQAAQSQCAKVYGSGSSAFLLRSPECFYHAPPEDTQGIYGLKDLVRVDVPALIERHIKEVSATLRAYGLPVPPRFEIWVGQSRTELATHIPGAVLVSDRLFEIFPIAAMRAFHERALKHALFSYAIAPWVKTLEDGRSVGWSIEARAALLVDLDDARRHHKQRSPRELVGFASFHPAVDQLLYAPQVAFEDVYFSQNSTDRFRDEPYRAFGNEARGRQVLESARDVFKARQWVILSRKLLDKKHSFVEALEEVDASSVPRLQDWVHAPSHPVNYRLGPWGSRKGDGGKGYTHHVVIYRDGARRAEPVVVRAEDENGRVLRAVWDEAGHQGRVTFQSNAPLAEVELDPDMRLMQSATLSDGHPRADDASSHAWRPPLLQAFGLNVFLTNFRVTGFVDFALRKRYNIDDAVAMTLDTDQASSGGSVRYVYGFGPKVHTNRRVASASVGVGFSRLHSAFGESGEGGWRASLGVGLNLNTKKYVVDPRTGHSLGWGLSISGVRKDSSEIGATVSSSIRGNLTIPFGLKNALVLVGGVGGSFSPVLDADRQALGGRFLLRAFEPDELLGDARAYGVAEHRYTLLSDRAWNALHMAWIRELQLAVFAGGGILYGEIGEGLWSMAAEAGAGMRLHFEYGGVQPGVFSLDLAFPLYREHRYVFNDGQAVRERQAIGLYLSFDQYF